MKKLVFLSVITLALLGTALPGAAHEFIIKPVQLDVAANHTLPFSVVSAHVFMISEEMEPPDQVAVSLIKKEAGQKVSLTPNEMLMTLDGQAKITDKGTWILSGHRKGIIWTNTTQGWKMASKKGLTGVISSGKYEKFCKTLINADGSDDGYAQVVGHRLEIVPKSDPAKAGKKDDLCFQILFDGKPYSTEVYATYDGFTLTPNTYAYFTETDENGVAKIKITRPGTWMVRVQKKTGPKNR